MRCRPKAVLVGSAVLLCGLSDAFAQPAPPLGSAASFAVLGGSAVISSGQTTVTGNLGVSPGNTITGSPTVKLGAIFRDDAIARQAQRDSAAAYKDLASRTCTSISTTTLGPGVYCVSSLAGTLTLDAGGNPDAVWIFQAPTTLTTAAGSSVRVINGGFEGNVFWQAGDSATLGEGTVFAGSILARNNITLKSGASLSGRALAQTGTVSLNSNSVSLCCTPITLAPATLADGRVGTPYGPVTFVASGETPPYTFAFSGSLPPGLTASGATLSGTPAKPGSYTFTVTATDALGCTGRQDYTILICGTIVLDPPELSKSCAASRQTITASGGIAPYTFRVAEGTLPGGVSLSSGGDLSGIPAPGCFIFTVEATDALSCTGRRTYKTCTIAISPPALPGGTAGTPYTTTTLTASGGTAPYTFSAAALPGGLSLSPSGELSGVPTTAGCVTFTVTVTDALGFTCTRTYTVCVAACPITISPPTLPDGCAGEPYSQTITAGGGTPPYTCSLNGTLPPGLSLGPCLISGTPTTAGCYTFTVIITDALGVACSRTYTICITPCAITIVPETLPPACVGLPYSAIITATGGTPPHTFSVTAGALPPELSLSPTGTLSGLPATAGCFPFTVLAKDSGTLSATKQYTVCSAAVVLSPATLPAAQAGVFYMRTVVPSGGTPPYTLVLSGRLPRGLTFDRVTGVISGTPIFGGPTMSMVIGDTFTVTATDANGCIGKQTYTIAVICPEIAISPPTLPNGNVGMPYSQTITAIGGTAPHTFTVTSGLVPPGLALSSGGTLSGAPTTTGTYCFSIATTDAAGCSGGPVAYTIVISAATCPAGTTITLSPPALPLAPTGVPYSQMITASGGTPPYTFSVTSGALPPGLTLNPATGVVSGTPTAGGTFTLTIAATDANGCLGSMGCSIVMDVDIPALSEWGMVMLSAFIAMIGVVAMRRGGV